MEFILNEQDISTDQPPGSTVLDFVRYHKNLKGTKIGCREGDCGACAILVGELVGDAVKYRTMTSCLMPLANARGKHIVTIEGINPPDRGLTPVQQAMIDESGTQCGFCTVGFVMSLTGFCIDETAKTSEMAISSIDGNICRCTGYKSIERAAERVCRQLAEGSRQFVPEYFAGIGARLNRLSSSDRKLPTANRQLFVSGGTDLYVQRPDQMVEAEATPLFYDEQLRGIRDTGEYIEIGASATVTDLLVSPVMQSIFPQLYKHLKLVSSTPIRNMATLAGNFINASPIGDMTVWFLALDAQIELASSVPRVSSPTVKEGLSGGSPRVSKGLTRKITLKDTFLGYKGVTRKIALKDLYLGYKQLAKDEDEYITTIRFRKPTGDFRFNFEKTSKRTYLDISTVNTAISLRVSSPSVSEGARPNGRASDTRYTITEAHIAAGGVAPIPLYLKETSAFLNGKRIHEDIITQATDIMQSEISPISDVRGTEQYKRLLLRQLFHAHFYELFAENAV